jgi:hypothetical protein
MRARHGKLLISTPSQPGPTEPGTDTDHLCIKRSESASIRVEPVRRARRFGGLRDRAAVGGHSRQGWPLPPHRNRPRLRRSPISGRAGPLVFYSSCKQISHAIEFRRLYRLGAVPNPGMHARTIQPTAIVPTDMTNATKALEIVPATIAATATNCNRPRLLRPMAAV